MYENVVLWYGISLMDRWFTTIHFSRQNLKSKGDLFNES